MNMKELSLNSYGQIPHIPPELLSQAVIKLDTFQAKGAFLTAAQISAVFTRLSVVDDQKLKTLNLYKNNLSSVPTQILVAGISEVEEVKLAIRLTTEQFTGIFTRLSVLEVLKLKTLDLSFNDLSIVPTETLVAGISGLEKVNLAGTRLTTEQLIGIFRGLSVLEDHKLKTLELNSYDLSSVPTDILVAGIFGLEKMNLAGTWLTTEQLTGIFTGLSVLEDHKLKTLILNKNNLSSVPTQMLVAVISGLEEVYLTQTELTSEQLTGIYRMVADRRCPRLREINLGGNNRSSSISQDLQDRAGLNESVFIYDW